MKVILICPKYPDALWMSKNAIKFLGKKSWSPPLGLLTVAAMLPKNWEIRFIDLNIKPLTAIDLKWADLVFVGAMISQQKSALQIIEQAHLMEKKIVAGGPLFCQELIEQGMFEVVDHIIVGEAEGILPKFLEDFSVNTAKPVYYPEKFPEIKTVPTPMWSLVDLNDYAMVNLQFTRGCPYKCDFCYGHIINGNIQRVKSKNQIIEELDAIFKSGWRSTIFLCDDNLTGNLTLVEKHLLPTITEWMQKNNYPFSFTGAACVNLAKSPDVMNMMVDAGFESVTLGIESPNQASLMEVQKRQNINLDLAEAVRTIQSHGLEVIAGMILGFDNDPPDIFQRHIDLIQQSGITNAMVSLLYAFPDTTLYNRLKSEARLIPYEIGDCVYGAINFRPVMPLETLTGGYEQVLRTLYSSEGFYKCIDNFLNHYRAVKRRIHINLSQLVIVVKVLYILGIKDPWRKHFWTVFVKSILKGWDAFIAFNRQVITWYFQRLDIEEYTSTSFYNKNYDYCHFVE